jgi:hypothetical protein
MKTAALALGLAASVVLMFGALVQLYYDYQKMLKEIEEIRNKDKGRVVDSFGKFVLLIMYQVSLRPRVDRVKIFWLYWRLMLTWSLVLLGSILAAFAALFALVAGG